MSREIPLGKTVIDQFAIYEADGYTKKSGETAFTVRLWKDAVPSSIAVTINEISSSGEYEVTFTPDAFGLWVLEIIPDYNKDVWFEEYDVDYGGETDINLSGSISDDMTTVKVALWLEIDGERVADLDSMTAKVKEPDGTEVVDLGAGSGPSTDGVFEFSFATSLLTTHAPYLVAGIATKGTRTWYGNVGFVKVG